MKTVYRSKLSRKGWTEKEVEKVEDVVYKAREHDLHYSKIVFWSALVVIIFANILVSLVLIPFIIALNTLGLYLIVALMAGVIGFLYNFLVNDIGHLEKKHHVLAGILVPLIAIGNLFMMVMVANRFTADLKLENSHDPLMIGIVFAIVFIIPYLIGSVRRAMQKKKAVLVS